ncbi:hypothetical protein VCSRO205_3838 [Vibrio cholerae]|nr:hypothetical protein VCSRO205_3838 [Vibrio cholerae]
MEEKIFFESNDVKARIQLRSATLVNIKQPMPFL